MNKQQKIMIAVMAVVGLLLAAWILMPKTTASHDEHGHEEQAKAPAKAEEKEQPASC
jgi:cobalt-zinc-cadmium efflux system membrane fusion protein